MQGQIFLLDRATKLKMHVSMSAVSQYDSQLALMMGRRALKMMSGRLRTAPASCRDGMMRHGGETAEMCLVLHFAWW